MNSDHVPNILLQKIVEHEVFVASLRRHHDEYSTCGICIKNGVNALAASDHPIADKVSSYRKTYIKNVVKSYIINNNLDGRALP